MVYGWKLEHTTQQSSTLSMCHVVQWSSYIKRRMTSNTLWAQSSNLYGVISNNKAIHPWHASSFYVINWKKQRILYFRCDQCVFSFNHFTSTLTINRYAHAPSTHTNAPQVVDWWLILQPQANCGVSSIMLLARTLVEPGQLYTAMNHQAADTHCGASHDSEKRLWTIKQLARTGVWARTVIHGYEPSSSWHALECEPGQWYTAMNHQAAGTYWVWARTVIHGYEPSNSWHALGCEPGQWYTTMNHQTADTHWGVSQDSDTRLWTIKQLARTGVWAMTVIHGYEPSSSWHALGCEPGQWYTVMNHQTAGTL